MPALRQASRSPVIASAVSATIGTCPPPAFSLPRIAWVASKPPIRGMCTSIRIMSKLPDSSAVRHSAPSFATFTVWPRFWSMVTVIF